MLFYYFKDVFSIKPFYLWGIQKLINRIISRCIVGILKANVYPLSNSLLFMFYFLCWLNFFFLCSHKSQAILYALFSGGIQTKIWMNLFVSKKELKNNNIKDFFFCYVWVIMCHEADFSSIFFLSHHHLFVPFFRTNKQNAENEMEIFLLAPERNNQNLMQCG